ncbi:MAG: oxygenase MpaB family protein [Methylovulum miyakonense]|uniref:oxygenase MpaB family protein n=1 Tax=Methylovulum miyakonense TaxID=645578 RepID=UPI003BB81119
MTTFQQPATDLSEAVRLQRFRRMGDPLADAAVADLAHLPKSGIDRLLHQTLEEGIDAVPDAPESWKALFRQADHVPYWVNWKVMNQASQVFLKAGVLGVFSLCCYATPLFYSLSLGNKPLASSGELKGRAPRRGRETARFVIETCLPNNLQRGADGFKVTMRVRLMHAHVRAGLLRSGHWDAEQLGLPVSQVYMAAMNALLSMKWIEGLRKLGFHMGPEEEEGVIQLWRYSAYLIGVDPELQFATYAEAAHFLELVLAQEPEPDEDSRQLVSALLAAVPDVLGLEGRAGCLMHSLCKGLSYAMMGEVLGKQLELPKTKWRYLGHLARAFIPVWRLLDRIFPSVHRTSQYYGTRFWLNLAEFPPQGGLEMFTSRHGRDGA